MSTTALLNLILNLLDQNQWLGYFINIGIKSSALLLIVCLITLLLKNYSAAARHLIWAVSLLGLLFLPIIIVFSPTIELAVSEFELTLISDLQGESISTSGEKLSRNINDWSFYIQATYYSVIFILLAYTFLGIFRVYVLTAKSKKVNSTKSIQELQKILSNEGELASIELLENSALLSPISWGVFRPVIILPESAQEWSADRIRNVLIHEVCHIQRLDWLTHILSRVVSAMYWFNPLIWLATRKIGEEAEQACDDAVILYGRNEKHYANDLLEIAKSVNHKRHQHLLAEAIAHSFLGNRIIAILDAKKIRHRTESFWAIRVLLVTLTSIIILSSLKIVPEIKISVINTVVDKFIPINFIPSKNNKQEKEEVLGNTAAEKPIKEYIYTSASPSIKREVSTLPITQNTAISTLPKITPVTTITLIPFSNSSSTSAIALQRSAPIYPEQATRRGIEGYTIVEFEISSEGYVINPTIVESSPGTIFNNSSITAMKNYRYAPPILNGEAVGINGLRTRFIYELNPKPN